MDRTELKKNYFHPQNLKQVPKNMKYGLQDMQRVSKSGLEPLLEISEPP
jgi:hypothetical protein